MRKTFVIVMATLVLVMSMASCSNTNEDLAVKADPESVTEIQTNLNLLNESYAHDAIETRSFWKFLRKLAVCCADVAGYILGGKADGATKLSELADKYLPKSSNSDPKNNGLDSIFTEGPTNQAHLDSITGTGNFTVKVDALSNLQPNEVGYVHNFVILNRYAQGELNSSTNVHEEEQAQSINELLTPDDFKQFEGIIPSDKLYATNAFSLQTVKDILEPIKNNKNISVSEYINALMKKTDDIDKQNQLKITGQVLEGLQYVDDNDTTYITKVREIIKRCCPSKAMQEKLFDAISIANASAKLWVTESSESEHADTEN